MELRAAKIDGAGKFVTFYKVVLPGSARDRCYSDLYYQCLEWISLCMILINDTSKMTIGGLRSLNIGNTGWGDMMAASVIVVLPSIILLNYQIKSQWSFWRIRKIVAWIEKTIVCKLWCCRHRILWCWIKDIWKKWWCSNYSCVWSRKCEAVAEELGARVASSLDGVVQSDDGLCDGSPWNLHKEPVIKAAISEWKKCILWKTIALSYEDCKEMVGNM